MSRDFPIAVGAALFNPEPTARPRQTVLAVGPPLFASVAAGSGLNDRACSWLQPQCGTTLARALVSPTARLRASGELRERNRRQAAGVMRTGACTPYSVLLPSPFASR